MQPQQPFTFGPYRFDPASEQLWRGKQEVRLTGKAAAVLRHLVNRAGQTVTKEELFTAIWPATVVSDAALTSCIQELRRALHDQARKPRFIETMHRRGFRFLTPLRVTPPVQGSTFKVPSQNSEPAPSPQHPAPALVGREPDLAFLHERLEKALNGERQLVFVTGEPGIGKTTLLEAFVQSLASSVQKKGKGQKAKRGARGWGLGTSAASPQAPSLKPLASPVSFAHGQCVEHYGAGEAYLPVLEALGRLCRESGGERLITLLNQHAPTWLVQMPALLSPTELEALQRKTQGVTRERMLRELAEALEVVTREQPLVLVLEDLHWSDVSTLELLSTLARRREAARLLLLGTYRPVEVMTREHPLKGIKQELQMHGQCEELALDFLSEAAVGEYLAQRFRAPSPANAGEGRGEGLSSVPLQALARYVHQRTDGNPLFMVNVTNELVTREVITQQDGQWEVRDKLEDEGVGVPVNLRQLIEHQIARVNPDERKLLEAASVAGAEFSAAAVAAGTEQSAEAVEAQCDGLVRREQFLRGRGTSEWPDGTIAGRYGFVHALYQEVLYEQLSASRRVRLHRQIGEREEQAYGDRAREIAAELAVHFERGRDYARAVRYLRYAGENAMQRSAHQEAISLLTRGLELLPFLSDSPERARLELDLQVTLGAALTPLKGYTAREVEQAYTRAQELCQQMGETSQLAHILWGRWAMYVVRADFRAAREQAEQFLKVAQSVQGSGLLLEGHNALGMTLLFLGEFALCQEHMARGLTLYNPQQHHALAALYGGQDAGVTCSCYVAWSLHCLGYPNQALKAMQETLALAQETSHPYSISFAHVIAAWLHQLRREGQVAQEHADAAIALTAELGFPHLLAQGSFVRGWALAEQGQAEMGIQQILQTLPEYEAIGVKLLLPYFFAFLAEAYEKRGQVEEAVAALAEAFTAVHKTGECWNEAELYRLKGDLTLQQFKVQGSTSKVENLHSAFRNSQLEAEACFLKAIDIARKQQAKSWELRASTSLARLWQQQGKQQEAHKLLSEVYNWFTEGLDTKDLQEAKALIKELSYWS